MMDAREAWKMAEHIGVPEIAEITKVAMEIYDINKENDMHWAWTFAALYNAGMVDGIRRERARRKNERYEA